MSIENSEAAREHAKYIRYGGVFINVVENSIPRVEKILSGFTGGWQQAVGSAIKKSRPSRANRFKKGRY